MEVHFLKDPFKTGPIRRTWRRFKRTLLAPFRFAQNVWWFRKELWAFRGWDYSYNLDLFVRSLEASRDFSISGKAVTETAEQTAYEINEFIRLLNTSQDGWSEAERQLEMEKGALEAEVLRGGLAPSTRSTLLAKKVMEVEESHWQQAMQYLQEHLRGWWD